MGTKSWEYRWKHVAPLSSGGHGNTQKVRDQSSPEESFYVLKTLKLPRNPERRARLYFEASALRALNHPQIVKLIDTNSEKIQFNEIDLYIVTEFIDGIPMSRIDSPVSFLEASNCLTQILSAVSHWQKLQLLHRDLKPDNVILRGNNVCDPIIIDFGQSFNSDDTLTGFETNSGQHLGNRFMQLPELSTSGADKRNQLSDISFCVGLLFFLLTKHPPEALLDHQKQKPHEREPMRTLLGKLPVTVLHQLTRIFEIGFSIEFDNRWQSAEELQEQIRRLADPASLQSSLSFTDRIKQTKQKIAASPESVARAQFQQFHSIFSSKVNEIFQAMKTEFGPEMQVHFDERAILDMPKCAGHHSLIINYLQYAKSIRITIRWAREAGQIILSAEVAYPHYLGNKPPHVQLVLATNNLVDPDIAPIFIAKSEDFITEQISKWFSELGTNR